MYLCTYIFIQLLSSLCSHHKAQCLQHALSHIQAVTAAHDFFESLSHLQTPESINEWINY